MSYAVCVDVGTTTAVAAVRCAGRLAVVGLGRGSEAVPALLATAPDGALLVGEEAAAARRAGQVLPGSTVGELTRQVGDTVAWGRGVSVPAHVLLGRLVAAVVDRVVEREGGVPAAVVLTVPGRWGEHRQGLLRAGAASAGLRGVVLVPEPVAAAALCAREGGLEVGDLVAVHDVGGGSLDCAVVRATPGGLELCPPARADEEAGGADLDHAVLRDVLAAAGLVPEGLDRSSSPDVLRGLATLQEACVQAKEALSALESVPVPVPAALPGARGPVVLTRARLEALARERVVRGVEVLRETVSGAGVELDELRGVLLVGGGSRMPAVARLLDEELGLAVLRPAASAQHVVCLGGAVLAPADPPGPARAPSTGRPAADSRTTRPPLPSRHPAAPGPAAECRTTRPPAPAPGPVAPAAPALPAPALPTPALPTPALPTPAPPTPTPATPGGPGPLAPPAAPTPPPGPAGRAEGRQRPPAAHGPAGSEAPAPPPRRSGARRRTVRAEPVVARLDGADSRAVARVLAVLLLGGLVLLAALISLDAPR